MGILFQDTAATNSRGSGNPGAWNPGSDGNNWATPFGGNYTLSWISGELGATGLSSNTRQPYTTTSQGHGIELWVRYKVTQAGDNCGVFFANSGSLTTEYAVILNSSATNQLQIIKRTGGSDTVEASYSYTPTVGHYFYVKAQWDANDQISAKVWDDTASVSEPGWLCNWTDSSPLSSGRFGIRLRAATDTNALRFDHFLIQTIAASTDITARLSLVGTVLKNLATRFWLGATNTVVKNITGRFRLISGTGGYHDAMSRFRLMSATTIKQVASRLRLGMLRDISTRFWYVDPPHNDITTRFSLTDAAHISAFRAQINARINFMNPSLIRTAANAVSWWCPTGIVGVYDWTNTQMQEWYAVFDNAQANGYTVIVAVNSPAPFTLLDIGWITAFADLIDYLINTLNYSCITYVSGMSEPNMLPQT